ncbi:MAG TPA: class I SAM-dependent methyltransferase [Opitutaceae bacterium]|jgi:ubiquinone/menaquinone biosynthesis C-methylase UbiE
MKEAPANFDSLARVYRALERVAFGGDLARARFSLLSSLADAESILILGEGDGRCLERLSTIAPRAKFRCIDASPAMLARAASRLGPVARARVQFEQADARAVELPSGAYDAVVTLFFLDCFTADEVRGLVAHVKPSLRMGGRWLFADFCEPASGWRRWRARAWLGLLYAFFRVTTRLSARRLPPAEEIIAAAGFVPQLTASFQQGMLRAVLFRAQ